MEFIQSIYVCNNHSTAAAATAAATMDDQRRVFPFHNVTIRQQRGVVQPPVRTPVIWGLREVSLVQLKRLITTTTVAFHFITQRADHHPSATKCRTVANEIHAQQPVTTTRRRDAGWTIKQRESPLKTWNLVDELGCWLFGQSHAVCVFTYPWTDSLMPVVTLLVFISYRDDDDESPPIAVNRGPPTWIIYINFPSAQTANLDGL